MKELEGRHDLKGNESLLAVDRLEAAELFGGGERLGVAIENGKDQADEVFIQQLIVALSAKIDVRRQRSNVRMRVVPTYHLKKWTTTDADSSVIRIP